MVRFQAFNVQRSDGRPSLSRLAAPRQGPYGMTDETDEHYMREALHWPVWHGMP